MIERENPKRKGFCDNVCQVVKEQDVKFIYLQFTDIHGLVKSFEISAKRIEDLLKDGEGFDGSSLLDMERLKKAIKLHIQILALFN